MSTTPRYSSLTKHKTTPLIQQGRIPPVYVILAVVQLKRPAQFRLRNQLGVLQSLLEAAAPCQLVGVRPQGPLRPSLRPGDVPRQPPLTLVQEIDDVIVVVMSVVVQVSVLKEFGPGNKTISN